MQKHGMNTHWLHKTGWMGLLAALLTLALAPAAQAAQVAITYTYDTAGRLTKAAYGELKTIQYAYDANGNLLEKKIMAALAGDVNGDGSITLADALDALKVQAGMNVSANSLSDVDNDQKIGLPEAEYVLQKTAGLRQ